MLLKTTLLIFTVAAAAIPYSRMMLNSLQTRSQGIATSGAKSSTLESAVLALSVEALSAQYGPRGYAPDDDDLFIGAVLDLAAKPFPDSARAVDQPMDRFALATAINRATAMGRVPISPSARLATVAIAASLPFQGRNPDGGLWYYHAYPHWSYLDGLFAILPYMASLPNRNETDMELQLALVQKHCDRPEGRPLLVHGYDWTRRAFWADMNNGASPHVWGRSVGWLLAGAIETWDLLGCGQGRASPSLCNRLQRLTISIAECLVNLADAESGAWRQLTVKGGQYGNYLESSSTALYTFALLKGQRIGMLPSGPPYRQVALRAYQYTLQNFVTYEKDTIIGYGRTVSVCSLNSSASYDYYVSRPLEPNSLLGESAFIFASLEVERLFPEPRDFTMEMAREVTDGSARGVSTWTFRRHHH
ncbi:glycosyl Hydrolase Family 88 [Ophiocordyceps camponoti-floridani]|uniref:Glycosyl Hydrolase Family 88 n=1 Tax=Ophiocordyceps camponoti-floridani TaxID=2030778 RepID=A0A8H4Q773_9HYPO|nr:glycosyl Hydrolase Family 88 [Ophiocordyceps camponoti-floridani]